MTRTAFPIKTMNAASLLNRLQAELHLTTDRALAQRLGINAPLISKIRSGKNAITASFLIRAHEVTGHSIRELRSFMGDDSGYFSSFRTPARDAGARAGRQARNGSARLPAARRGGEGVA